MPSQSRRQFFGSVGKAAVAAGALSVMPRSIARALSIPASSPTGTIDDVAHVVILMQENRSFDHYFGTMAGVRGFGDRFTVPLPDGRSVWEQSDGARTVLPYHLDSTAGNAQRVDGTPHSWHDAQQAWDGGRMSAWPVAKEQHSMGYYTREEIPFQFALAEAFTICDAYHCSIQAGTNPNRLFLWTGTNGPTGAGVAAVVNEWDSLGPAAEGYDWTTYPERLQDAGVGWKVYQWLPDNFGDNSLAGFRRFRAANAAMGNDPDGVPYPPYDDGHDAVDPLIKGIANTMPDGGFMEAFRSDIEAGRLPQVSWIVAPSAYSEHPGPSSPVQGASYVETVLDALTAVPEVWAKTVLLVNFDENDGFFDHVPPPAAPALSEDGGDTGASTVDVAAERFTHAAAPGTAEQPAPDGGVYGLGPRVPLFVVSPWSRGGWVDSQVFDHTSVIRFLEERFGVVEPNISPWRRAVCGDLRSAFNFAQPDDEPLPELPTVTRRGSDLVRVAQERLPQVAIPGVDAQRLPAQEPGTRPSRALPYELDVVSAIDVAAGSVGLTFLNRGEAGAVFHVYDRAHLDRLPRRYTVEARKDLTGEWFVAEEDDGAYDLWVLGPNGFHRTFAGDIAAELEVSVAVDAAQRRVEVTVRNDGADEIVCSVDDAYGDAVAELPVSAGGIAVEVRNAAANGGWYDLALTASGGFERRLAGRIENGEHSTSDPAAGA